MTTHRDATEKTLLFREYKSRYYQKNKERIKQKRIDKINETKRQFYYSCIAKKHEDCQNKSPVQEIRDEPLRN